MAEDDLHRELFTNSEVIEQVFKLELHNLITRVKKECYFFHVGSMVAR